MELLKNGFRKTIRAVAEHKKVFILLIVLQAIILAMFGFVFINYQLKIFADIDGITMPLAQANYNETSIQQGMPFMEDLVTVIKSYSSMIQHVLEMALWISGIFVFVNGALWLLSHWMVEEKAEGKKPIIFYLKKYLNQWLKFLAAFLVIVLPFAIWGYLLFKLFFTLDVSPDSNQFQLFFQILPYLMMMAYYFLLAAFAMMNIVSWKMFVKKWFEVSVKKIYWTLIILLINLILIFIGLGSISLVMSYESTQSLLFVLTPILLLILVLTRIFWIVCLHELVRDDEKSHY